MACQPNSSRAFQRPKPTSIRAMSSHSTARRRAGQGLRPAPSHRYTWKHKLREKARPAAPCTLRRRLNIRCRRQAGGPAVSVRCMSRIGMRSQRTALRRERTRAMTLFGNDKRTAVAEIGPGECAYVPQGCGHTCRISGTRRPIWSACSTAASTRKVAFGMAEERAAPSARQQFRNEGRRGREVRSQALIDRRRDLSFQAPGLTGETGGFVQQTGGLLRAELNPNVLARVPVHLPSLVATSFRIVGTAVIVAVGAPAAVALGQLEVAGIDVNSTAAFGKLQMAGSACKPPSRLGK